MTQRPPDPSRRPSEPAYEGGTVEEVLEEVTGFNFRSFRTLRDLFWRPALVFSAYAAGERIYTPALRLWLSLTVVLSVVTYFFGSHEDLFYNAYLNWPAATQERLLSNVNGDLRDLAAIQGEIFGLLNSWVTGVASLTAIGLVAGLSGSLRWAVRFNLVFSLATVGTVVSLAAFPIMVSRPDIGIALVPIIVVVYAVTFARGIVGLGGMAARCSIFTA